MNSGIIVSQSEVGQAAGFTAVPVLRPHRASRLYFRGSTSHCYYSSLAADFAPRPSGDGFDNYLKDFYFI